MPDHVYGDKPAGYPDSKPLPVTPFELAVEQRIVALEANQRSQNQQTQPNNLLADVRRGEWWLIAINGFLLLATIVIACIYNAQLKQMTKATRAAQQAAFESCRGDQISRAALIEIQKGAVNTRLSTVANTYQAMVAIQAQSPNIQAVVGKPTIYAGKVISYPLEWKNIGKANAINFVAWARATFDDPNVRLEFTYSKKNSSGINMPLLQADHSTLALGDRVPDSVPVIRKDGGFKIADSQDVADFEASKKYIYVYGRATYKDSFGVRHWVQFCTLAQNIDRQSRITGNESCVKYNRDDTNTKLARPATSDSKNQELSEITCTDPSKE